MLKNNKATEGDKIIAELLLEAGEPMVENILIDIWLKSDKTNWYLINRINSRGNGSVHSFT